MPPPLGSLAAIATALDHVMHGNLGVASKVLETALDLALSGGYVRDALRLLLHLCDIERATGESSAKNRVDQLATLADEYGSARYAAIAGFHRAIEDSTKVGWLALEQIASRPEVSSRASRRARWLLGEEISLSASETICLESSLADHRACPAHGELDASECWGLDVRSGRVWLTDREVTIGMGLPMRLLLQLIEDGSTDKERLICVVWDERDYHPLRHDAKLKNAIRKLRKLIEDDDGAPTRILTTDDGYSLAANHLVRLAR